MKLMPKGVAIARDTIAYGLQSVLPQVLNFCLLPLYTAVLTPTDYASVDLATVFAAFAAGVVHLQLPAIIGRFFFDCEDHEVPSFFSTIFLATACLAGAATLLIVVFGQVLVDWVYPASKPSFFPLFFLATVSVALTALSRVCSTLLQVRKEATLILRISILVVVVHFSASIIYILGLRLGGLGLLLATVTSGLVNLAALSYAVRSNFTRKLEPSHLRPGLKYCTPLIPHMYGAMLFVSSDKIILEKFITLEALGIYAVAAKLASPLLIIVDAFNQAISPRFMESSKRSKTETAREYREIITKWLAAVTFAWLAFSALGTEVVLLVTPKTYHGVNSFLAILAASYIFRGLYCFAVNPLFFEKKTNWVPLITFTAGVANVVLNLIFVPRFGVITAAWTTLISYALTFVLAFLIARKIYAMEYDTNRLITIALVGLVFAMTNNMITIDDTLLRVVIKSTFLACELAAFFLLGRFANAPFQTIPSSISNHRESN